MTQVFDQQRIRRAFDNAAESYDQAAVLQKEVCKRLLEKLDVARLDPAWILDAGTGTGEAVKSLQKKYKKAELVLFDLSESMLQKAVRQGLLFRKPHQVCGNIESLPFANQSFDLLFSNLAMQWCNDLAAALIEFKRVLRPGALLQFATFGPDTLKELRASWQKVDAAVHVNSFIDMHDIGDVLLQAGFAEPVMESEIITVNYREVDTLMQDLRDIGANVTANGHRQGLLTRNMLKQLREAYEVYRQDGVLPATYEVVYGHAWVAESSRDIEVKFTG
ncbi:MAG: malonyl-ACP O-methyltransferase BioC [Gammaproteobacteria bacterium]|nr:malonyl-ACP O-methyltransferase BioC [Gammaproteobacteria bacterium]MCW8923917.1 malonyl-ACP O-methyltransferase BioC [Gammaproteobacteria bacterium]